MTKDKTVTMSRELILQAANRLSDLGQLHISEPMFGALLAAPVVERQEPVGYANSNDLVCDGYSHSFTVRSEQPGNNYVDGGVPVALYTSPPAPVAVVLPERKREDAYDESQSVITYHAECGWNLYDDELKRLNPWLLDKVKEMNR